MNRLAEVARREACRPFCGKIVGSGPNIQEIVALFPKWSVDVKEDAISVEEGDFNTVPCIVERKRDAHIRCYIKIPEDLRY